MLISARARQTGIFTALIAFASVFSAFWYFNAPIYDFLSAYQLNEKTAKVVLIEEDSEFKTSNDKNENKKTLINKLEKFGAEKVVFISEGVDLVTPDTEELLQDGRKFSVSTMPIQLEIANSRQLNKVLPKATLPLLEPVDDLDGVVRRFYPQAYADADLPCIECQLSSQGANSSNVGKPFLINFLNGDSNLPKVASSQVLNDWVPGEMFRGKIVVVDQTLSTFSEVYRTSLFSKQKVSFSYYVASVLNSIATQQQHYLLPNYALVALLLALSILLSFLLRDISLHAGLISLAIASIAMLALNSLSLWLMQTFVPMVELLLLMSVHIYFAIGSRRHLVIQDIRASNASLELVLAETNALQEQGDTSLCANLFNFFSRAGQLQGLSVYELDSNGNASCSLTFKQPILETSSLAPLIEHIERLSTQPEVIERSQNLDEDSSILLIPYHKDRKLAAAVAINFSALDEQNKSLQTKLTELSEKYRNELQAEVIEWVDNRKASSLTEKVDETYISGRQRTLAFRNRQYVKELMQRYQQTKGNYNELELAVAVYDIYGTLKSINASAESFAKQNELVWYGVALSELISEVSHLNDEQAKELINGILLSGVTHRFMLKGTLKDHIAVLSQRHVLNESEQRSATGRTYLTLEITNVTNVGTSARLKDSYVRDLTNQIKQDLSTLALTVDKLTMLEKDTEKYNYLSDVVDKLSERMNRSRQFMIDLPAIESNTHYSVNVMEKLEETLDSLEQALAEKNINLVYHKPSFINQIVLDYRNLQFVFDFLFNMLVDDSQVNSSMEINLSETATASGHFVSLVVNNTGYGLPQALLDSSSDQSGADPALQRCIDFAESHGGTLDVSTVAGEGIKFHMQLPVDTKLH
ncbi:MAG: CHASE2 domain-containing protein [Acidiferrobacterales bacterium]|nr:CHASE2 domain-containing protein [Acidiferrobacterales bacterium]